MQFTDKQLVLACRRGEASAWETLVNRYQRLIYAIPRRAGLDEDRAAEVFQEVFTTLVQKLDDIDDPDRLHAWLVTIARRKTARLVSGSRARQEVSLSLDPEESEQQFENIRDSGLLPDEVMVQLEEQHLTRIALTELDERCRNLLTLLFYETEQPSYAEIANRLGMSEGSIGPTRARCLEKMLRLLQK